MKRKPSILFLALATLLWLSACASRKQTTGSAAAGPSDGSSFERAIVINEQHEQPGIRAEYNWLAVHYPNY